jgi:hypothetical protein
VLMILQVAVLQSHLEVFQSEGKTRSAPSQEIVISETTEKLSLNALT